ncbi:Solute carrier family 15 member 2, partial [Geodia barretti]
TLEIISLQQISEKESLPDGGKSSFRVINTVVPESYVNFTLYSKRCNCSLESCGSEVLTQHIPFPTVSDSMQVDPKSSHVLRGAGTTIVQTSIREDSYSVKFRLAEYTLLFWGTLTMKSISSVVELHANSVSRFLQTPNVQHLITAPVSMKALCQAAWLWTVAIGNLFVIIIAEGRIFENQALEFFFFAACIGGVAILFAVMSFFYKYVDLSTYNQLQQEGEGDEVSSDETRALILSHDKEQEQKQSREKNEKGNESEF